MTEPNRTFVGTCGVVAVVAMVALGLCGGCLFLGILGQQAHDATKAEADLAFVDSAKAAVMKNFQGNVKIVSASLDRPADNGYLVAGKYQTPGDRQRDFLATVTTAGGGCRVTHLIVDGEVVLPRP